MSVIDDLIAAGEVLSPGVRAAIAERESLIRVLRARLAQGSRNSSQDLPGSKREKKKPSGRKRGG